MTEKISSKPFFKKENLKLILVITFLIHLVASIYSVGFHHLDEHYQILEFADFKLGVDKPSDLPWEYGARVRPTIQPAIAYVIIEVSDLIGISNPFDQAMITRIISSIISIFCMYLLFIAFKDEINSEKLTNWFIYLSFFLWFLIYTGVRFSSEGWSGSFFFIGFALIFLKGKFRHTFTNFFLTGVILGFSFLFRYQAGIMIFGLLLWMIIIDREKWSTVIGIAAGILTAVVIGVLIDKWFYDEWVLTAWNYLDFNLIKGRASDFGVEPWYFYLKEIFREGIPPFSLILIGSFIFIFISKPKSVLTWTLLPFILVHFLIGHKELRFLFPLVNVAPLIFVLAIQAFENESSSLAAGTLKNFRIKLLDKRWRWFVNLFVIVNTIYLVNVCFRPADYYVSLYQFIYNKYNNEKTVLLYSDNDPYLRAPQPANFYKSKNTTTIKVDGTDEIKQAVDYFRGEKILLLTDTFLLDKKFETGNLYFRKVYQNLPKWVGLFNYNSWLERTKIFTVYEVSDK